MDEVVRDVAAMVRVLVFRTTWWARRLALAAPIVLPAAIHAGPALATTAAAVHAPGILFQIQETFSAWFFATIASLVTSLRTPFGQTVASIVMFCCCLLLFRLASRPESATLAPNQSKLSAHHVTDNQSDPPSGFSNPRAGLAPAVKGPTPLSSGLEPALTAARHDPTAVVARAAVQARASPAPPNRGAVQPSATPPPSPVPSNSASASTGAQPQHSPVLKRTVVNVTATGSQQEAASVLETTMEVAVQRQENISTEAPAGASSPSDSAAASNEELAAEAALLKSMKNPASPVIFAASVASVVGGGIVQPLSSKRPAAEHTNATHCRAPMSVGSDASAAGRALQISGGRVEPPVTKSGSANAIWMLAAPFAPLLISSKGTARPVAAWQAPTVRHKADPLTAMRNWARPTQRHGWDPIAQMPLVKAPIDNSKYDPWVQLHRIKAPTAAPGFDPLTAITRITAPSGKPMFDPLSGVSVERPTARHGVDPIASIARIHAPRVKLAIDPLTHLAGVRVPRVRHNADPLPAVLAARAPSARPMWDPMTHMPSVAPSVRRPTWDPLTALSRVEAPSGTSPFDPLSRLGRIIPPKASSLQKYDWFKALIEATRDFRAQRLSVGAGAQVHREDAGGTPTECAGVAADGPEAGWYFVHQRLIH